MNESEENSLPASSSFMRGRSGKMAASIKQLEAFYWAAKLGGFTEAARHLNLAQSTVSKRIIELESVVGGALFDRSASALALTRAGTASLPIAADVLAAELRFREAASGTAPFTGAFRFGTTELVALTWLSSLIVALKRTYPDVVPMPDVAASRDLFARLGANELDLVIALDPPPRPDFKAIPLASVTLEWVAAPGYGPASDRVPLAEMARYPILSQAHGSGLQALVLDWAAANGLTFNRVAECNSLNVLAGLAAAGLGVTYLTASFFETDIARGSLRIIRTDPPIPPIRYFAVYRALDVSPLPARIASITQMTCDFSARNLHRKD